MKFSVKREVRREVLIVPQGTPSGKRDKRIGTLNEGTSDLKGLVSKGIKLDNEAAITVTCHSGASQGGNGG